MFKLYQTVGAPIVINSDQIIQVAKQNGKEGYCFVNMTHGCGFEVLADLNDFVTSSVSSVESVTTESVNDENNNDVSKLNSASVDNSGNDAQNSLANNNQEVSQVETTDLAKSKRAKI